MIPDTVNSITRNITAQKAMRREQTQQELERLAHSVSGWLKRRHDADYEQNIYIGRHKTQLEAIGSVLTDALAELRREIENLDLTRDIGVVYHDCRDYEEAIVWLQRLWEYFAEKFAQRDNSDDLRQILKAADEVVWSCYRQVVPKGPAPLTFIQAEYSPGALQADKPLPPSLRLTADVDFLDEFIRSLPVPMLQLPPWCVKSPWWLVYVAHEVGHHVQHDLKLVAHFRDGVKAAAKAVGLSAGEVDTWGRWGEEIFADVFSLFMMGPWALWAMVEAEWGTAQEMVQRRANYPSPVVRLELMARTASKLGMDSVSVLRGLNLESIAATHPQAQRDMQVVEGAINFALGPLPGDLGKLENLCNADPALGRFEWPEDEVEKWTQHLRGKTDRGLQRHLITARLVTSGSLRAWSLTAGLQTEARDAERQVLIKQTLETLLNNGPEGTRAGPSGQLPGKGTDLAKRLLQSRQERNSRASNSVGEETHAV